jgi:hypothetical protein
VPQGQRAKLADRSQFKIGDPDGRNLFERGYVAGIIQVKLGRKLPKPCSPWEFDHISGGWYRLYRPPSMKTIRYLVGLAVLEPHKVTCVWGNFKSCLSHCDSMMLSIGSQPRFGRAFAKRKRNLRVAKESSQVEPETLVAKREYLGNLYPDIREDFDFLTSHELHDLFLRLKDTRLSSEEVLAIIEELQDA